MFTLTVKFCATVCFSMLALASVPRAQVCQPVTVGLQAWYSGDGNALDSRSRNNGILTGTTFVAGENGQGYRFAPNDNLTADGSVSLNVVGNEITIESWIKLENNTIDPARDISAYIGKSNFPAENYALLFEGGLIGNSQPGPQLPANQWQIEYILTNTAGTRVHNQRTGVFVTVDGAYHHFAVTYKGSDPVTSNVKIYVDGVLQATNISNTVDQISGSIKQTPAAPFSISSAGTNASVSIDETAIYNRTLSAVEIQGIFAAGTAGKCKPTATVAPSSMVGWWGGDGDPRDISGNNNLGTLQNGAGFAIGKVGQGFSFDGVDDYVRIPISPSLQTVSNAITIDMWVKLNAMPGVDGALLLNNHIQSSGSPVSGVVLVVGQNGAVAFQTRLNNICCQVAVSSDGALQLGVWGHVTGVWDGANLHLYINGIEVNSVPGTGTLQMNRDIFLGINADNFFGPPGITHQFNGSIDEVDIFNRALTQPEITSIFNAGIAGKLKQNATISSSSLVSLWQGEGNASDTRNLNNGTLTNGTSFATGKIGQALSFDGVDDFVQLPSNSSLNPTSITVEGWLNPNPIQSSIGGMIYSNRQANISEGFTLGFNAAPSSNLIIILKTAGGIAILTSPVNSIESGKFQHVAVTYDETIGTVTALINGLPVSLSISGTLSGPLFAASNPVIGRRETGAGSGNFNGLIDELAIYNRPLSQTEIRANYEAGNALSTVVGDVRVTFPTVTTPGNTQQIPIAGSVLPALPGGMTSTGLFYDIATSAVTTGNAFLCFNLQSFAGLSSAEFHERRILHLEAGVWADRTSAYAFASRTVCATSPSLSPFAIVDSNLAPTAAMVSVSGRVLTSMGRGISKARVSLIDSEGNVRTALTGSLGYYRFDDLTAGESYVISVLSKRFTFAAPTQIISAKDNVSDVDFIANE